MENISSDKKKLFFLIHREDGMHVLSRIYSSHQTFE